MATEQIWQPTGRGNRNGIRRIWEGNSDTIPKMAAAAMCLEVPDFLQTDKLNI